MERVDLLDLQGDVGERDCLCVPWEIAWVYSGSEVGHGFWFKATKTEKEDRLLMPAVVFGAGFHC